jgi:uroporphyrinogen decarboxylase
LEEQIADPRNGAQRRIDVNSRERIVTSLQHKEPDRMPLGLGAMLSTSITGIAYNELKDYLSIQGGRTRMYDLGQ